MADVEANEKKMLEWQKESSRMYAGYAHIWLYNGKEYVVDASRKNEMKEMGAKIMSIFL